MTISKEAFGEWMTYVLAKRYINVDGAHGAQCWDLFGHFCDWFGIARVNTYGGRWSGWAGALVDQFATNGASANFDLIGPDQPAQVADTAVWGDSYWYYPKTHVAQVLADAGSLLLCVSQNSSASQADNPYPGDSTGPTIIQHLPKQGLIGYLRPKGGINPQGNTTTQEEDMPLSGDDHQFILEAIDDYFKNHRPFDGNRNIIDAMKQTRTDVISTKAAVEAVPQTVLFDTKVEGRNLFDSIKQVRADVFGTRGNVDVQALAKELASQLEAKDVAALAEQLQITVKGS